MKIIDLFPFRQLNEHAFIKHSYLFLNEAIYDTKITSLKKKFPDSEPDIDAQLSWAKSIFKTPGQINWWINLYGDYLENKLSTKQLGDYQFKSIEQLQTDISHYFGFNYQPIQTFVFDNKTVKQILTDLSNLENQFKQKQEKESPVQIQEGDRKLYSPMNGTQWWFVNRAYCPDEGRSGKHCGNVMGKHKPEQRILSLRDLRGNVILTFIYEPDGTLGEMKAKGNLKPSPKYHPQIKQLLLGHDLPIIGISGMGYLPEMNFSVFDFNEEDLSDVFRKNPKLIKSQLKVTPIEFLKAPDWIRKNSEIRKFVFSKLPGLQSLINDTGDITTSLDNWEQAIKKDVRLILNAPNTIDDYYKRMRNYIIDQPSELLRAPVELRKDFDFLMSIINNKNYQIIQYIMPTIPRYEDIILNAVSLYGKALIYVPEESRTEKICLEAVKQDGMALIYVPEESRTEKICQAAINDDVFAIKFVPRSLISQKLCLSLVKRNGMVFQYLPQELLNEEICIAAVTQTGYALNYIPKELCNEKIYLAAVNQLGAAIEYVPKKFLTYEICLAAVKQDGSALAYIPEQLRNEELCLAAVANGGSIWLVPGNLRHKIKQSMSQK